LPAQEKLRFHEVHFPREGRMNGNAIGEDASVSSPGACRESLAVEAFPNLVKAVKRGVEFVGAHLFVGHFLGVMIVEDSKESDDESGSVLAVEAVHVNRPKAFILEGFDCEADPLGLRGPEDIAQVGGGPGGVDDGHAQFRRLLIRSFGREVQHDDRFNALGFQVRPALRSRLSAPVDSRSDDAEVRDASDGRFLPGFRGGARSAQACRA